MVVLRHLEAFYDIVRTWNVNNSVVRRAIYMKFSQLVRQIVCDNLWKFHANRTTDDRVIKVLGSDDFTRCKDFIRVYCSKTCKTSSVMCRTLKWSFKHGNSFPTFVYVCIHFIHGANLIDNVWCLSTHPNIQVLTLTHSEGCHDPGRDHPIPHVTSYPCSKLVAHEKDDMTHRPSYTPCRKCSMFKACGTWQGWYDPNTDHHISHVASSRNTGLSSPSETVPYA